MATRDINASAVVETIREGLAGYVSALTNVLALLDVPTYQLAPADRSVMRELCTTMVDVGVLGNYHLNCPDKQAVHLVQHLVDTRAKLERLANS
jgi:hypothetical protein